MIYVMSDLHGCYDEYIKMLELINFSEEDTLYILGDVCDRGPNPMKILLHMMAHDNIIPLFGNHDIDAYNGMIKLYNKETDRYENWFLHWVADGGRETVRSFEKLDVKTQCEVLSYMEDFNYYIEIKVNGVDYILVHGGFKDFNKEKPLESYHPLDLVWERPDYDKVYFEDKIIISGHTPTVFIDRSKKGKIVKLNNHIAIDCGCVFGYGLGCLCLDTMEEYYV